MNRAGSIFKETPDCMKFMEAPVIMNEEDNELFYTTGGLAMSRMRIFVAGATGNVGRCITRAIMQGSSYELVGGFCSETGQDIATAAGLKCGGLYCIADMQYALDEARPEMVIDFTSAGIIMDNLSIYAKNKINAVIGTTGLNEEMLAEARELAKDAGTRWAIISNFGMGMNFVMDFLKKIRPHYPYVSIIDRHQADMANAPSGTAITLAETASGGEKGRIRSSEVIPGVMGGKVGEVQILSQRMPYPGPYSEHEITLGRPDELIRITVQDFSSEVYLPGVFLAVDRIGTFPPGTVITNLSELEV